MESSKLKLKVGIHEFEAEGTPDNIAEHLRIWKELIASPVASAAAITPASGAQLDPTDGREAISPNRAGEAVALKLYQLEPNGDLIVLQALPNTESREADAILLVVYGYRLLRDTDQVLATKVLESLRRSGINLDRMDRAIAPHIVANKVLRTGVGKGGKYRLTTVGVQAAETIARNLVSTLA